MSGETRVSETCIEAVAVALLDDYATEYQADHLTWRDFEIPARRVIEAASTVLRYRASLVPSPSDDEPYSLGFNTAIDVLNQETEAAK